MKSGEKGFTLAELLIALALLGVIAAFTIPKIFRAQGNREQVSKVREVVSSMEESYYGMRDNNEVVETNTPWFDWVNANNPNGPKMNVLRASTTAIDLVDAAGNPLNGASRADGSSTHPCGNGAQSVQTAAVAQGWAQFSNGVIVTGLGSAAAAPAYGAPGANNIFLFCIDVNGATNPNTPAIDVFLTNFQHTRSGTAFYHQGDPDGAGAVLGAGHTQYQIQKAGAGGDLADPVLGAMIYDPTPPIAVNAAAVGQLLTDR